jgi:hypothetical protein
MLSRERQKVNCECPQFHTGLVDPRTRHRHLEQYGIADTPESTASAHDSNPSISIHPEEDIEDVWGMPGSPSDAMEVDNPAQSDQEDSSFQRHEDEDEDDDDRPVGLIDEDEEGEGEQEDEGEDEGEDEDEEVFEEEDGFVDGTAPEDDLSELRRLASMTGHPLSFRTSLTCRLES